MGGPTPADVAAEVGRLAGSGDSTLALAVSGGPDSLALLLLAAAAFGPGTPGERPLHVLSVDHGLRAEAAAECALAADCANRLGLPHTTLTLALEPGGDIQARAREARYAAMADWCRQRGIPHLLTAHHADDQAETLLMRLARGSGVAGLAGIRPARDLDGAPPVRVLRPLLGYRRAELAAVVTAAGWLAADDPSNRDPRFDRTWARALLARTPALASLRLAATAANLAEAEAALDWAATRAFDTRSRKDNDTLLLDPEGLPAELQRRLLARGLVQFGTTADGPALVRLADRLRAGGSGTLGAVRARALPDGQWLLRPAPPRLTG